MGAGGVGIGGGVRGIVPSGSGVGMRAGVGIGGRARGIVPSGSGVGLGESAGRGGGVGRTVCGVRSGLVFGVGVGSGAFVETGNWLFVCASATKGSRNATKKDQTEP